MMERTLNCKLRTERTTCLTLNCSSLNELKKHIPFYFKDKLIELSSARQRKLLSIHYWEESPFGIWKFKIKQDSKGKYCKY